MIIDAHAHLVTPMSAWAIRSLIQASAGHNSADYLRSFVSDDELKVQADKNVALMDEVGTDIQLLSPRPFAMMHSAKLWSDIDLWIQIQNDLIHRVTQFYPERFRGVAGLPQSAAKPIDVVFDEIDRCVNELNFVGVMVNPDPDEGTGDHPSPRLGDEYWHPLWEKLCKMNIPAHIHGAACYGRENYDEHFATEESLAISSIAAAKTFEKFPDLKLMISHGGGAIPYQIGRWRAHWYREQVLADPEIAAHAQACKAARLAGKPMPAKPDQLVSFDDVLRKFYFDTCIQSKEALELLFKTVGASCCCFGTERPGSGSAIDPDTGYDMDDIKVLVESMDCLTKKEKQEIFSGNARRLFSRIDRQLVKGN